MGPSAVLDFWFKELKPADWFSGDGALDARIRDRFGELNARALRGELYSWRATPEGRLAEILVLDQFSRNIHRGTAAAFAGDPIALTLAQEAVALGVPERLPLQARSFVYMPYMHSESLLIHREARRLFSEPGLENGLDFEIRHEKILQRFGRYPHRNEALGRESTPEEREFLKQPGSSF